MPMTTTEAIALIQTAIPVKGKSTWIDLGCGAGTFTYALADLLGADSKIIAIDRLNQHLGSKRGQVAIEFKQADFENQALSFNNMDGILIANALHYVKDQSEFIKNIKPWLTDNGQLILIEYDTDRGNQWVPFPITFEKAQLLLTEAGFKDVKKIGEKDSLFRSDKIFACMACK